MRQKKQKLTSASWLRPVRGGFLIRFNCAPFFASCRRHRVLTVTYLDACRCAVYLRHARNQFEAGRKQSILHAGFLLGLFFNPEHVSNMLLRDVGWLSTLYGFISQKIHYSSPDRVRIFPSSCRPDRLCGPPNFLSTGYRVLFLRGLSGPGVKLTNQLQLVPRWRKCGSIHSLPHTPSWGSP
jgi:hypothetical protein